MGGSARKVPPMSVSGAKEHRQRERARRWQTERMRAIADRIEAGDFVEASQADIDAIFDRADAEHSTT